MALLEYTPEKVKVEAKGQVFGEVRGLALEDVAVLLREHLPDLEGIMSLVENAAIAESFVVQDWLKLAMPIVTQAPGLAANVIATAADEPTGAPLVQKWPLSVQLAALVAVFDLTFSEMGEVKKALEIVAALLKQKKPATKVTKK